MLSDNGFALDHLHRSRDLGYRQEKAAGIRAAAC